MTTLKSISYENEDRLFSDAEDKKYRENFQLFDRDGDERISFTELQELLTSIGYIYEEQELSELYKELEDSEGQGIRSDALFILVSKKKREQDREEQLIEAFKSVDLENTGYIQSEYFKELLMTMGYRFTEDEADEYMKFIDPKNEGKFLYIDIVKKILK
uniref:Calmodulin 7-1 n=1 Tax=Paramecium tetraurelia TaxID=5888 RepID=Q3SDW6_PARTE|nr:calmodulin 7-1 [Paramecium tetraurelia]